MLASHGQRFALLLAVASLQTGAASLPHRTNTIRTSVRLEDGRCLPRTGTVVALVTVLNDTRRHGMSVLFVGNSLTYVGNTPAVFDALAAANGAAASSDMIVKGGATLSQRVSDGSIARALGAKRYRAVVLQERGGDLMCSFGPDSCADSRNAIQLVVALAKRSGTAVYLLGTYQGDPSASKAIVSAESAAADEAGIPYIEISEKLQALRTAAPGMEWNASDGVHPGSALALLNAASLHRALLGKSPEPRAFAVHAPIYSTTSGLTESVRQAEDPAPLGTTSRKVEYSEEALRTVLKALGSGPAANNSSRPTLLRGAAQPSRCAP